MLVIIAVLTAQSAACMDASLGAAGDHLYRINYQDSVNTHRILGADMTVAAAGSYILHRWSYHAAGDHLYRMNYQDFVNTHRVSGADITVAALPTSEKLASAFGLMKIDNSGRIIDFAEKPSGDALRAMQVDTTVLGLSPER